MAARMERIMGIPQQTKKPSSLKNPRDQPAPRYINKQAAIDIARKLKLKKVGKVGLRITNATSIDSEMMSKYRNLEETNREMSQKSIMDRRKGLEMARNIAESRVGKCIMETNDYEMRRFNRQFDKLLDDEDQKKRQMTQKKREFVHQKQKTDASQTLTRADGRKSPLVPQTSDSDHHHSHLPNIYPVGATQQHARNHGNATPRDAFDYPGTESRGKSPGYMRPLSCNRDKSHDSAVGETERFLSSPYMRAYISTINDYEMTNRVLEGIEEANESGSRRESPSRSRATSAKESRPGPTAGEETTKTPEATPTNPEETSLSSKLKNVLRDAKRPVSQGMSLSKLLLTKRLNEIQETTESTTSSRQQSPLPPKYGEESVNERAGSNIEGNIDGGQKEADVNKVETVKDMDSSKQHESSSKPPSRGKFLVELMKSEFSSKPGSPSILIESFRSDQDGGSATPRKMMGFASITKRIKDKGEDGTDSPDDGVKKSKTSSSNSLTVAAQIALLRTRTTSRKKRRTKAKIASTQQARGLQLSDRAHLMKDPRFTGLSNMLIPDSAKAHDLYHSSGQFNLPDHMQKPSNKMNTSRMKDSKFRSSKNLENLARFEKLFDTI